jgi:hypothetical protein
MQRHAHAHALEGRADVSAPLSCASGVAFPHFFAPAPQNARALLRNSLPIKNKQIRIVQNSLESITEDLRVPGVRFSVRSLSLALALFRSTLRRLCAPPCVPVFALTLLACRTTRMRAALAQGVDGSVRRSLQIVKNESAALLADVPAANKADATAALARLKTSLEEFSAIVANKDKQEARDWQRGRQRTQRCTGRSQYAPLLGCASHHRCR